jgi:predicted small lipoprotein YifL
MRRTLSCGFVVAVLLAIAGCGGPLKYKVASTRLAPGADADMTADVNDSQNNTAVVLKITNLPPADRVSPQAKFFVAWARKGDSGVWARLGTIKFDLEKRTGEITTTVPERAFDFEISAEPDESAQSPSADVVFTQRVSK